MWPLFFSFPHFSVFGLVRKIELVNGYLLANVRNSLRRIVSWSHTETVRTRYCLSTHRRRQLWME